VEASNDPLTAGRERVAGGMPRLYRIDEALSFLGGFSQSWFFAQVAAGRIRVAKLGKRTFVTDDEIRRLIAEATSDTRPAA
jgi:hypothetical protein